MHLRSLPRPHRHLPRLSCGGSGTIAAKRPVRLQQSDDGRKEHSRLPFSSRKSGTRLVMPRSSVAGGLSPRAEMWRKFLFISSVSGLGAVTRAGKREDAASSGIASVHCWGRIPSVYLSTVPSGMLLDGTLFFGFPIADPAPIPACRP